MYFPNIVAELFSSSISTPALSIALHDNNRGMSDSTTFVLIVTSLPAITAGRQYSALDFRLVPPPNLNVFSPVLYLIFFLSLSFSELI